MSESTQQITPPERMPLGEFLAWEHAQPVRHERVGGRVWAMVGGTLDHNTIALGLVGALRRRLAGTDCRRIRRGPNGVGASGERRVRR